MKYSKQRELIYNCVIAEPLHLTADAIYEKLRKESPNLSLGTVYRNLSQLTEHKMIKKISTPGEPDRFDGTLEKHFHFHCSSCLKVEDLMIDELNKVEDIVESITGNKVETVELSFKGVCAECKDIKEEVA